MTDAISVQMDPASVVSDLMQGVVVEMGFQLREGSVIAVKVNFAHDSDARAWAQLADSDPNVLLWVSSGTANHTDAHPMSEKHFPALTGHGTVFVLLNLIHLIPNW